MCANKLASVSAEKVAPQFLTPHLNFLRPFSMLGRIMVSRTISLSVTLCREWMCWTSSSNSSKITKFWFSRSLVESFRKQVSFKNIGLGNQLFWKFYFLKMCPFFVDSAHNFDKSDSSRRICGFMFSLHKKIWTVSSPPTIPSEMSKMSIYILKESGMKIDSWDQENMTPKCF